MKGRRPEASAKTAVKQGKSPTMREVVATLDAVARALQILPIASFPAGEGLISVPEAARASGLGESTYWELLRSDPDAPRVSHIGSRCTRLVLSEARAYALRLAERHRAPEPARRNTKPGVRT